MTDFISKELFVSIIKNIQSQRKREEKFAKALEDSLIMSSYVMFNDSLYYKSLIDLLKLYVDPYEYIEWYLFETSTYKVEETIKNGKKKFWTVNTPEKLYDFLLSNYKKETSE